MRIPLLTLIILSLLVASSSSPALCPDLPPLEFRESLNSYVLAVLDEYSIGHFPYLLNKDYANYNGVTEDIHFNGKLMLKADPSGNRASHCVGITFEVFFKAMQARNLALGLEPEDFNGMTYDELFDFVLTWYVAKGPKDVSTVASAVEKYGIGRRIYDFSKAQPGDFMDISRENGTGHTTVFINWITVRGRIIGVRYWSSQSGGIDYNDEYFNVIAPNGRKYGNVLMDQVYIARVGSVHAYLPVRHNPPK